MRIVLATMILFAAICPAATITFSGTLSGANESPAVVTAGTGFTTVTYDSTLHLLTVDVTFSNLTGLTTASHIHCCVPAGGNAGVATTTPTFAGFPLNVTAGVYHNVLDLTSPSSWNPAFITDNGGTTASAEAVFGAGFIAGQTYLNIHTTVDPGGEIRAFLIPEPTTWTLVAVSLLVLALKRKALHRP
ncbi:MAG: hypothetical protein JWO19_4073 [Bryobacterales bacterium]|jgi:hypothetical protein|nr:hypothetical protein [Bryobacterales bacterium]